MSDVYVIGIDMIKFGRFPDITVPKLGATAANMALDDAGLSIRDMQALYSGNLGQAGAMVGQRRAVQDYVRAYLVDRAGKALGGKQITSDGVLAPRRRTRVAHHADNLVARLQLPHSVRAEESARPGDQPSHALIVP